MYQPIRFLKSSISYLVLIPVMYACFGATAAQAVSPAPDGGYPAGNTAEGTDALFSLTSGVWNTAIGHQTLYRDSSGSSNTAEGIRALFGNTTGGNNTATGVYALYNNTTGSQNVALGNGALQNNTTAMRNTAIGFQALLSNNTDDNTAVGYQALLHNTGTSVGRNCAFGSQALFSNTTAGNASNAFGWHALYSQTTGEFNNGFGWQALASNITGSDNTALGDAAGSAITGDFNICIGSGVVGVDGDNNTIRIGDNLTQTGSACFIGGISGQSAIGGEAVFVTTEGKLGTITTVSSRRFKDDIKPMDNTSEAILALKPVTFRYKKEIEPKGILQFGLVAEEVEKVDPDLVRRDDKGQAYTVRYEAVNAMLLNEFLKTHRKMEEQQKEIGALTAQLKKQAALIEKVSNKVELIKPKPQVVANQ